MVAAAVDGAVDYSRAELDNPRWQAGHTLRLAGYLEERRRRQQELEGLSLLAAMASLKSTAPGWEKLQERASESLWQATRRLLFLTDQGVAGRQQVAQQLSTLWEREFGSLSDPATQRQIDQLAKALKQGRHKQ